MNKFLNRLNSIFCSFQLVYLVYFVTWIGITYRSLGMIALSVYASKLTDRDPYLIHLAYTIGLVYVVLTLAINIVTVFGVRKELLVLITPYIVVEALEFFISCLCVIAGIFLLWKSDNELYLSYLIPLGLVFIIFIIMSWIWLLKLYREIESMLEEGKTNVPSEITTKQTEEVTSVLSI